MRWLFSVLFFINGQLLISQSILDFQSKQPFFLEVNGHSINSYPCERITFDVDLEEGKCEVKTTFMIGGSFNQSIVLKPGYRTEYQLGKDKKSNWKWLLLGESAIVLDTLSLNEIPSLEQVFEAHGKCLSPMKTADFNDLLEECSQFHKSQEKMNLIAKKTQDLCCTVEQVAQLLAAIELEDEKLDLLVEMVDKIYNWKDRQSLISSFFTERGQNKAALLLQ